MPSPLARLSAALADRYTIQRELGAGGMATVYLAEDVKHRRKVAVKVLRPELAAVIGAERFLHEIETTANLQHPHILPLHDSGTVDGTVFYVMPFVDGESLRDRLDREKQLPIADALRITKEIASALDYAHRKGIIHRDIKPENILLHEGQALVADFGIALAVTTTGSARMTETGMSLGTPHYMSPEQAMGERTLDARADVYALACVLYEMLVGEPPFTGPTAQAIVARVLTSAPEALTRRRPTTPAHVDAAVLHALEKLPADRFASAAMFADALSDSSTSWSARASAPVATPVRASRATTFTIGGLTAVALTAAVVAAWALRERAIASDQPVVRFTVPLGDGANLQALAVSPDGRRIAYITDSATVPRLSVRALDSTTSRAMPAADGLRYGGTAFSPDGKWLAFINHGKLLKAPIAGGPAQPIADVEGANGMLWTRDNMIVLGGYGARGSGLRQVPASGGVLRALTTAAAGARGHLHMYPVALADDERIAFTDYGPGGAEDDFVSVTSRRKGVVVNTTIVGQAHGYAAGRLLYTAIGDDALMTVPFDADKPRATNDASVVALGAWNAALSASGVLVSASGGRAARFEWVSADGRTATPIPGLDSVLRGSDPRLSPDGTRLAFAVNLNNDRNKQIAVYTFANATTSPLASIGLRPEWTPDGTRVLYQSTRPDVKSSTGLLWQAADGSGMYEPLGTEATQADGAIYSGIISPDSKWLLYRTNSDVGLRTVAMGSADASRTFVAAGASASMPRFSPDGGWVAYVTGETARREVQVRPFPGPGPVITVSSGGGTEPLWSRDGTKLFYRNGRKIIAVDIARAPAFRVVSRATLFEGDFLASPNYPQYDVARDGRFVMLRPSGGSAQIQVVVNWTRELEGRR